METTIQQHQTEEENSKPALSKWKQFINWADKQEENHLGWTAFSLTAHGCLFTIVTVFVIYLAGNHFIFWPFAIAAMAATLLTNLAAMPTKITIPTLFASVLLDIIIIAICLISML
ncbi:MAG: hypothetical protein R2796_04990 [Chitinophagaceae bacterium]|nr:hypothetical protein [Chitinophagaceae bacterium]HQU55981.1 hypothetical protein [Chitinophagaceae bacterium]